jgi:hypothetical protein
MHERSNWQRQEVGVTPPRREIVSEWHDETLAHWGPDDRPVEDLGEHTVSVLSSALLRAVRWRHGEGHEGFALRAGVATEVVIAAEDGTCPAWALPYDDFMALAEATACCALAALETAVACDLLLTCVLNGDQVFATDVVMELGSRNLAWVLLSLAIAGGSDRALPGVGSLKLVENVVTLDDAQVALLRERVEALAASASPDAWVGAEIAAVCGGELS